MMKKVRKYHIYDKIHRGSVMFMMGLTGVGCSMLVFRMYRYFTYVRPLQQEQKRMIVEDQVASEQSEREQELLRRQREAETLRA